MRNKFTSIALSLLVAFGLWGYVITTVSPGYEDTFYNVNVIQEGIALLEERNLVVTYQSASRVAVSASGNRTDVNKLDPGNITVKLDLSRIYEPGTMIPLQYTVSYPGDIPSGAVTTTRKNPDTIYVTVEERREKQVPVEVVWVGATAEGFMSDRSSVVLDYTEVTVIGPASVADLIEKAVIEVDLTERRESIEENYRYTLCDAAGDPVDAEMIKTNVEQIHLSLNIRRVQELKLRLDVIYGGGSDVSNTVVTLSTDTIRVSGSEAALSTLGDTLTLGRLNLSYIVDQRDIPGTVQSSEIPFAIRLPEGVYNETGITEIVVSVAYTGLGLKDVTIPEERITVENLPEGLRADISDKRLNVFIRGPKGELELLENAAIYAVVDLSDAKLGESKRIPVTIRLPESMKAFGAVGSYSVLVDILPAGDN